MSTVTMATSRRCGVATAASTARWRRSSAGRPAAGTPEFQQFTNGSRARNTDWNNFAPNLSAAWRPNVQGGLAARILGDPDQATLRGGYSIAYDRRAWGSSPASYGANPGSTLSLTRNANERPGAGG